MLKQIKQLYKAFQAYKRSEMGDFALLKFDAIASIYPPEIISKLQPLVGYHAYMPDSSILSSFLGNLKPFPLIFKKGKK